MGIFNENSSTSSHTIGSERGLRGPAGIGFVLTQDGNYDIQNNNRLM